MCVCKVYSWSERGATPSRGCVSNLQNLDDLGMDASHASTSLLFTSCESGSRLTTVLFRQPRHESGPMLLDIQFVLPRNWMSHESSKCNSLTPKHTAQSYCKSSNHQSCTSRCQIRCKCLAPFVRNMVRSGAHKKLTKNLKRERQQLGNHVAMNHNLPDIASSTIAPNAAVLDNESSPQPARNTFTDTCYLVETGSSESAFSGLITSAEGNWQKIKMDWARSEHCLVNSEDTILTPNLCEQPSPTGSAFSPVKDQN